MQRSPPGTAVPHAISENDLTSLDPLDYVGRRQKRLRREDQDCEEPSLKDELLTLLSNWKKDQDLVLNKLSSDIAELKLQNSNIQSTAADLEKAVQFMSSQYEELKSKLVILERERKENIVYIDTLESKIDDLQKRLKSTTIEFRNLPPISPSVKQETQRDLCDLVQKTCDVFKAPVHPSEIKDIYRIKNRSGATTVVTELTSVLSKNKILNGVREFNKTNHNNKLSSTSIGLPGPQIPIFVTESLTTKDRKLFGLAREASKNLQYKFCWTNNGRIYMRKSEGGTRIEIKGESDLAALQKQ